MGEGWVRDGCEEGDGMGEGVAMRHTCNRRVEDAEEVGPPRGGPPGWRGVGPLSPSNALRLQTARGNQHWSHRANDTP